MPLQALHKHDGRNKGWPLMLVTKLHQQRYRLLGPFCKTGDSARIEDQHEVSSPDELGVAQFAVRQQRRVSAEPL